MKQIIQLGKWFARNVTPPALTVVSDPGKDSEDTLDALRRKIYVIALLLGLASALINLVFNADYLGKLDSYQRVFLPALALTCLFLVLLLKWGKHTQRKVEIGMCVMAVTSLLSRLVYSLYSGNAKLDINTEISVIATWFPLTYILYHLILDGRRAAMAAWLSYAAAIALSLPSVITTIRDGFGDYQLFVVLQLYTSNPVYIILLTVLSSLKERYASAQTQAALMTHLAMYDALTDLHNRRYIEETLPRIVQRAQRNDAPLGLIMLDIDHFKHFNDTYGHEAGDMILKQVADYLQTHIRAGDIACRYGGEEFLVILPGAKLGSTQRRAEYLRQGATSLQIQSAGQSLGQVTLSLGVAVFPDHGSSAEEVMQAADAALYRSKDAGRNRVTVFDAE